MNTSGKVYEKAQRFIEYLQKLSANRKEAVRSLDHEDYIDVLWLSQVPQEKGCYCRIWGLEEKKGENIWIEMQISKEPSMPDYPDICRDWVDKNTLRDTQKIPALKEKIEKTEKLETRNGVVEYVVRKYDLKDFPEIQSEWQSYVENAWLSWAVLYEEWFRIHKVYAQLFAMYQELMKEGEKYELLLSQGLLKWKKRDNYKVRRHLIVANATIEFDRVKKKFVVKASEMGTDLRPEFDMLDTEDVPPGTQELSKNGLMAAEGDPFDTGITEGVLKAIVHSLGPKTAGGDFSSSAKEGETGFPDKPTVEYAPALILRKRSGKGLSVVLEKIREQIKLENCTLGEFGKLLELDFSHGENPSSDRKREGVPDVEVFFPKPANNEQKRIVEKLRTSKGILVQGPPGTGKSHTIANLICHLLATGNRILVTAKAPRALQVLAGENGLVDKEIRPLCINMLGEGSEEHRSLEASINSIFLKQDTWQEETQQEKRRELESLLHKLRKESAELSTRIRSIRESESFSQSIVDGAYRGTATQIAQRLEEERERKGWLADRISHDQNYPFAGVDFKRLVEVQTSFSEDKKAELRLMLPDPAQIPRPEELGRQSQAEQVAIKRRAELEKSIPIQKNAHIPTESREGLLALKEDLSKIAHEIKKIRTTTPQWADKAISEILSGNDAVWLEIRKATQAILAGMEEFIRKAETIQMSLPEGVEEKKVLIDARTLKRHLEEGGSLGWGPFRAKVVKERMYLIKETSVDGFPCKDTSKLSDLIKALTVKLEMARAWEIWKGRANREDGTYGIQMRVLQTYSESIDRIVTVKKNITQMEERTVFPDRLPKPIWYDDSSIQLILETIERDLCMIDEREAKTSLEEMKKRTAVFDTPNTHPVIKEILFSINNRDADKYAHLISQVEILKEEKKKLEWAEQSFDFVQKKAPWLASSLNENFISAGKHLSLPDAWKWSQARNWLDEYIAKEEGTSLRSRVKQLEAKIGQTLAEVAEIRAWSFCMSRMKEEHRRHMEAWAQSMRKKGKGMGKHALKHQKDAQYHMSNCKDAVPAWVMPLHRVWDTVNPACGIFDVIIIDEASQCGYEALPLLYLGKKIVIVGDDKQISPEAGFVEGDTVRRLMDEFLYDFEHKDSFDNATSLFAHGKILYSDRISLREHFRCMPEIIDFCNMNFYKDTPLLPLRQYPPNRLDPKVHVHVANGYREGESGKIINRPEAEAIASKIAELCGDPRYRGLTMGVIALQGHAQAKLIEELLLKNLDVDEIKERRIICGEPYSFQGDERDVIFLSMIVAPGSSTRITALTDEKYRRSYNVAVSRAKDQIWLFHSVKREDLSPAPDDLRRKLLDFFEDNVTLDIAGVSVEDLREQAIVADRRVLGAPDPFDSWFEVDVCLEIAERRYKVIPQFRVADYRLDLVVEGGEKRIAIECDGDAFHGIEQYENDMYRQRVLENRGWCFFRIRGSEFYANRTKALAKLWGLLEERGIFPQYLEPKHEERECAQQPSVVMKKFVEDEDFYVQEGDHVTYHFEDNPLEKHTALVTNERTPLMRTLIDAMIGEKLDLAKNDGVDKSIVVERIRRKHESSG